MNEKPPDTENALSILEEAKQFARKHLSGQLGIDSREFFTGWWENVAYHDIEYAGLLGFADGSTERWTRKSDFAPWFQAHLEKDSLARQVACQLVAKKLARGAQLSPAESEFTQKYLRGQFQNKQGRHWADNRLRDLVLAGAVKIILRNYDTTKEEVFLIVAEAANEITRPLDKSKRLALSADSVKKLYLAHGERKVHISFT